VRRGQRLGVGVESGGVYHSSWFGAVFYPWDLIGGIAVHPRLMTVNLVLNGRGTNWARNPAGGDAGEGAFFRAAQRRRLTRLPLGNLAVRPGAALQALELYEAQPELRAELDTEAGLQRLRRTAVR
jgi:hypothetical protein